MRRLRFPSFSSSSVISLNRLSASTRTCSSLESKFEALAATVNKQQVALAGLTKKIFTHSAPTSTIQTPDQLNSLISQINQLKSTLEGVEQRLKEMEKTLNLTAFSHQQQQQQQQSSLSSSQSSLDSSSARQLSEITSRLSAIESRQAVVRISQKRQSSDFSSSNQNQSNSRYGKPKDLPTTSDDEGSGGEALLVTMEPGVDGTPRLTTCQVRVFHPTALAPEIRHLMEGAGPVVSCLRKPGGASANDRNNNNKYSHNHNNNNNNNNNNNESRNRSLPCFVVTFQSTVDATRAIENISGMTIRGQRVQVEAHVFPEQMMVVSNASTSHVPGGEDTDRAY